MKLDPLLQARLGTMFAAPEGGRELSGQLLLVSIEKLRTGAQPRQNFEEAPLQDLAASIRELKGAGKGIAETGILQPILVRAGRGEDGGITYTVTAGERRLRAAKIAGLEQVPVVVSKSDDEDAWEQAIVENLLRADLSPLEEASAFDKLMKSRGYSVREAAKRLGKDKGYLENRLFLLRAPADVQEMVSARGDTVRAAREIARVEDAKARRKLIEFALGGASFGEIQERVKQATSQPNGGVSARADTPTNGGSSGNAPAAMPDFDRTLAGLGKAIAQVQEAAQQLPTEAAPSKGDKAKARWAKLLLQQAKELQTLAEQLKS